MAQTAIQPTFDRIPPQNIDAEISVLGSMLISKDAIADVLKFCMSKIFIALSTPLFFARSLIFLRTEIQQMR